MGGGALTDSAFAARLDALFPDGPPATIAVAVSGGPDSLVLAHLAKTWADARHIKLVALTVDHGLRPDSASEAVQVATWMTDVGIPHHILTWSGDKPDTGVQAAAREARYALMTAWCQAHDVADLLLAHHRDDQAETFLLRLARGSGVSGLAAMAPVQARNGVRLLRPLLDVSKGELAAFLKAHGLAWVEDPSNRNPDFDRVRVRQAMPDLAGLGLDAETLAKTARRMARTRAYLEAQVEALLRAAVRLDPLGFALIDSTALAAQHEEIGLRALSRLLTCVGGNAYPPRLEPLERLWGQIAEKDALDQTLAGCRLKTRKDGLWLCREVSACAGEVRAEDGKAFWGNRFRLSGLPAGAVVRRMDDDGWRAASARWPDAVKALKSGLPAMVRHSLPGVFEGGTLIAIPFAPEGSAGVGLCFDPVTPLYQQVNFA